MRLPNSIRLLERSYLQYKTKPMQIMFLLALAVLGGIALSLAIGSWIFLRVIRAQRPVFVFPSFRQWVSIGLGTCGFGALILMVFFNVFSPKKVSMDDQRIQPLLKAAGQFSRLQYGFTPIPNTADVRYESRSRDRYDAMLHITAKTSRTVAFRKEGSGYREIEEQETFQGPKKYSTVDGTFNEEICLTFGTEPVSGFPVNRLSVTYRGEDLRLVHKRELSLEDIKPVLKEWGY